MVGANDAEVTSIKSGHIGDTQPFRRRHDASVRPAEPQICIANDQFCHPTKIAVGGRRELVPLIGERQS